MKVPADLNLQQGHTVTVVLHSADPSGQREALAKRHLVAIEVQLNSFRSCTRVGETNQCGQSLVLGELSQKLDDLQKESERLMLSFWM